MYNIKFECITLLSCIQILFQKHTYTFFQREKMSKVTMAYVVVNLIIVVSCLAASAQGAQSKSKIEESTSDATDITPVNDEIKDAIAYITEFLNDTNGYSNNL